MDSFGYEGLLSSFLTLARCLYIYPTLPSIKRGDDFSRIDEPSSNVSNLGSPGLGYDLPFGFAEATNLEVLHAFWPAMSINIEARLADVDSFT